LRLPFSIEEFLAVFAAYNRGVWPAQLGLYGLGVFLVVVALRGSGPRTRWGIAAGLGLLWAWMGAVYHLRYFAEINPAAPLFGALFLVQATLWIVWTAQVPALRFRPEKTAQCVIGGLLLGYAVVVYPLLNLLFGHAYPTMPTFGLPCPTTIATLGFLAWATPRPRWYVWPIPVLWALIGTSAAFALGIREDLALVPAAILALAAQLKWAQGRS